jgi:S-adenosylmethionine-diacylglycerol 3-amino-3-carboxypropyl transferase
MKRKPLQFAITREDPELELEILRGSNSTEVLLVCSAGDTIFALKKAYPDLRITAFDFNPHQIDHYRQKVTANSVVSLCQLGNFESMFSMWRFFFNEFILTTLETKQLFEYEDHVIRDEMFNSPYWSVSFDLYFHDSFLRAMFGDAAVQHAPKGSYSRYFQKVFEKGLRQKGFGRNPFLQHIFFGDF